MLAYKLEENEQTSIEVKSNVIKDIKKIFKGHRKNKHYEIFNFLLVEVNEKEQMVVSYTTNTITVQKSFNVIDTFVANSSSFLLPIQSIKDLKYLGKDEVIKFTIIDNQTFSIEREGIETTIPTLDADDFPSVQSLLNKDFTLMEVDLEGTDYLNKNDLKPFLKAGMSVSTSETRPVLTNMALVNGEIISTDSHRLFKGKTIMKKNENTTLLPIDMFVKANDLLEKHELFQLACNDQNEIKLISDSLTIIERSADGNYPDISRLLPNDFKLEFTIEKIHQFVTAIDTIKGNQALVTMTYDKNNKMIELKATDNNQTSTTTLPVKIKYDRSIDHNFKISFSAFYVKTAIQQMDKNYTNFKFVSNMRPFVIDNDVNKDMALVLPVRTF